MTPLNISTILTHFFVILFSFACFINCITFGKKCGKSISFGIIDNFFVKLAIVSFSISCSSISFLSRFSLAILFRFFSSFSFFISRFSSSFILSIFCSSCLSIYFLISLGFDIFINAKKRFFIMILKLHQHCPFITTAVTSGFGQTEEILNGKLHFLCRDTQKAPNNQRISDV